MFRKILFCITMLIAAVSCREQIDSPTDSSIQISVSEVHLNAAGVADSPLTIKSGSGWTASVPVSWLKFDPTSADAGETTVSISAEVNDNVVARSVEVLVFSDKDSKTVKVMQDPREVEFSCTSSVNQFAFPDAYDYNSFELTVTTGEDAVDVDLTDAPWLEVEGDLKSIPSDSERTLKISPIEPNYSRSSRTAIVRFVGRNTGESVEVSATQEGSFQDEEESLHNLWRLSSEMASTSTWRNEKRMIANRGDQKGILSVEASVNSNVSIVADGNNAAFKGMSSGDAVVLRTPVKNIPAGTDVSAMLCLAQRTINAPRDWVVEYWDKDKWNEIRLFFTCNESADYECASVICDFTLSEPVVNDFVKVRFRMVSDATSVVNYIPSSPWCGAALAVNADVPAIKETKKVLVFGNSFTYYWGSAFLLKQIARSQGYRLDMRANMDPGAPLLDHARTFDISKALTKEGGYDFALLQEKSTTHAYYADGEYLSALSEAQLLVGEIRASSPSCQIILENTWSYSKSSYMGHGSFQAFDEMLRKGCEEIAEEIDAKISPINHAFEIARESVPDIELLHTDGHHPSRYGTYLKSCVNFITMFDEGFEHPVYLWEIPKANAQILVEEALKIKEIN